MKTLCIALVTIFALQVGESSRIMSNKNKRGYYGDSYSLGIENYGGTQPGWQGGDLPIQGGWDDYLQVDLAAPAPQLSILSSNSIVEKPVMEAQEIVPPQSVGQAVIPRMPPPATPVNAAAANVPSQTGAVFLGSGSLGVVSLGNGAYALGSGSLGYAGNRAQPRPSFSVPVYPRLPASPDLIPAAVPSPQPPQPALPNFGTSFDVNNNPVYGVPQVPQYDQNGYEYLAPNRVGFGAPSRIFRRPKIRQQFATATNGQIPPQIQQVDPPAISYDFSIPFNSHPTAIGI